MKRIAFTVTAAALLSTLLGASPARADFHGFCPGASATIALARSGTNLNFSGTVNCVGSPAAAINLLTITPLGGATTNGTTPSCTSCTGPIVGNGSVPAATGEYDVRMTFTVTNPSNGLSVTRKRLGRYLFTPAGLTKVCPTSGESCPLP